MSITLLHSPRLSPAAREIITAAIPGELEPRETHFRLHHRMPAAPDRIMALRAQLPFDINPLPENFCAEAVRLVVSDMDSTLIAIECIDELADLAGIRQQMAPITAATMRGELDFSASLRQRLALLAGLDVAMLDTVYRERMRLSPGARELLAGLAERSIPFALVTGGSSFFSSRLQQALGFAYHRGINLEVAAGCLTGSISGALIDAQAKAAYLRELCAEEGIAASQSIAIGDGVNDAAMLQAAGVGIAFRGKPLLQSQADAVLNHSGLDAVLDFIG